MRILIAEDEKKTATYLAKGLSESGFTVAISDRGDDALHPALTQEHDLLILDVMLPELDGWGILEAVRRAGGQTPVLFLTARDAVADRVKGLKLGADDYLVKPFAFSELLARVRSLLRRAPGRQPETLRVADLELDLIRHRAERGGQRLDLTPKEFALLSLLARRRGEVLSRIDRRTGLGHELRQRHERRGRRGQTVAQQGGRSVPAQIDPYRAWVGLCPR